MDNDTNAAPDASLEENDTQPATGDTTPENPDGVTSDGITEGDGEGDVTSSADDGKIDVTEVNRIVKTRVERVREKTKLEAQKAAEEEIEFWREKAKGQKTETTLIQVPEQPNPANYGSDPTKYAKDMEDWAKLKSQSEQYLNNIVRSYQARAVEFAKDKADYQKSVEFFNSVSIEPVVQTAILESEHGPAISYYLSKNFKEFDRINKLSPISVAREIAKLELKLTGQLKEVEPVVKKKAVPKPTTPVTGAAPISNSMESLRKNDVEAFIRERKKANAANRIIR